MIGWKLINLSQIVSIAEQLNFNCIVRIWSDKFSGFAVEDKQKASYEEVAVNKNTTKSTET